MKKLKKETITERGKIAARLREEYSKLQVAIEDYNAAMEQAWAKVDEAMSAYNEVVGEANTWKDEVASDIQSFVDDKSEKWQESEAAQRYASWKEPYDEEFADVEIDEPDKLESEIEDIAELMEQLQEELE